MIEDNNKAIEYFSEILRDIKSTHYKLAVEIAFRPKLINELSIQRKMFLAAFQSLRKDNFRKLLELYTGIDHKFLNKEIILSIENISRGDENLKEIETVIENFVVSITSKSHLSKTSIPNLFQLLVSYGVNHPSSYERIRRFFLQYELYGSTKDLRAIA